MKTFAMLAVMILAAVSLASAEGGTNVLRDGKPHFEATEVVTKNATVLAINKVNRVLTLKTSAGDTIVVPVKPEVATFNQIKVKDRIKITYTDKFTIDADTSGAAETTRESMRTDAKAGETPSATVIERTIYRASITAIDMEKGTVTLKDEAGPTFTVQPVHPENLKLVSVGDVVTFTTMHTMAASIVKTPPKKAAPKK